MVYLTAARRKKSIHLQKNVDKEKKVFYKDEVSSTVQLSHTAQQAQKKEFTMLQLVKSEREVESRSEVSEVGKEVILTIETDSYNEKRYSKPWIAKIESWEVGEYPVLKFGNFIGEEGCAGVLELKTKIGALIKKGQKDYRKPYSENNFYIVKSESEIERITPAKALKHFREQQKI